jgi:SAM-dependent methyltransferase
MSHPVSTYYDDFAASYDDDTAGRWTANELLGALLDLLGLEEEPRRVLDLGAGTGQTVASIRARFPHATVVAVDASAGMLARLRQRCPHVTTVHTDAAAFLRTDERSFDLITSVGMLDLVADLPGVLRWASARLRPGGSLVCTYEPIIPGIGQQGDRTNVCSGRSADGREAAIVKHRWHPDEMHRLLAEAVLSVRAHRLFVAYLNSGTPVVYGIAWATSRRSAGMPSSARRAATVLR